MKTLKKYSIVMAITAAMILFALYCTGFFGSHLLLTQSTFSRLPHWKRADQRQSLLAFQRSCTEILKRNPALPFGTLPNSGSVGDWQTICVAANKLHNPDAVTARHFFETWFAPYRVLDHLNPKGLFTGYYLPLLHGNLTQTKQYNTPIYAVPSDLIKVNLGLFRPELSGKTLVAQLKDNKLSPYPNRTAISEGVIRKNAPVIAWSDSELDVFFAQIQGSAVVQLPNHQQFVIGYASNNGRAYTAIGKILVQKQALDKHAVSMQTIRAWLQSNPDQVQDILNHNASYVFFRRLKESDPVGTEQVPLTPEHTLAVDTRYIPLGTPLWLATTIPENNTPFSRLVIAQDTGGAIKGIVRGDVYWGEGEQAALIAGHMQSKGQYWALLPKPQQG